MWNSAVRQFPPSLADLERTSFSDMRDVVVLEVENPLRVLDDGGRVGRDEELDGLRHAVVAEEGATLAPLEFAGGASYGDEERVGGDLGDDL